MNNVYRCNKRHSVAATLVAMLLTVTGTAQEKMGRDVDVTLLSVGKSTWRISLSKRRFEGDTIYILTFRDIKGHTRSKTAFQGFFKPELKDFCSALNTALTIGLNPINRFLPIDDAISIKG